jgi:hypothetical protein
MYVTMGLFEVNETSGGICLCLFNLNHWFQILNWCIVWLHLWKMRVIIWQPWHPHYIPILSKFLNTKTFLICVKLCS